MNTNNNVGLGLALIICIAMLFLCVVWMGRTLYDNSELKEVNRDLKETYTRYLMTTQEELIRLRNENKAFKDKEAK